MKWVKRLCSEMLSQHAEARCEQMTPLLKMKDYIQFLIGGHWKCHPQMSCFKSAVAGWKDYEKYGFVVTKKMPISTIWSELDLQRLTNF